MSEQNDGKGEFPLSSRNFGPILGQNKEQKKKKREREREMSSLIDPLFCPLLPVPVNFSPT